VNCGNCGESENVKRFYHFDNQPSEFLCWDCRWPTIEERLRPPSPDPPELSGQVSLLDF